MAFVCRRAALIGSVSLLALAGSTAVAQEAARRKETISAEKARATVEDVVTRQILPASEKEFGVVYTPADVRRINAQVWDRTHAVMRQHFTFE